MFVWLSLQTEEVLFVAFKKIIVCYAWPTSPFNDDTSFYFGFNEAYHTLSVLVTENLDYVNGNVKI